jgi:hypothetical protein
MRCLLLGLLALALLLVASRASGVIIGLHEDEFDHEKVLHEVQDDERIKVFSRDIHAFREVLYRLKERDLLAFFGPKVMKSRGTFALPSGEPRGYMMSGLAPADPTQNKSHWDFYLIGPVGGIEVL